MRVPVPEENQSEKLAILTLTFDYFDYFDYFDFIRKKTHFLCRVLAYFLWACEICKYFFLVFDSKTVLNENRTHRPPISTSDF